MNPLPDNKFLKMLLFGLFISLIIFFSLTIYLLFQNQKLKNQSSNNIIPVIQEMSPTPKSISSISIPTNSIENWRIYQDENLGISFQYPKEWILGQYGDPSSERLLNNQIDWTVSKFSNKDCRGDCPIITIFKEIRINETTSALEIDGWVGSVGGEIPQSYRKYEIKHPDKDEYFIITLWELKRGKGVNYNKYSPDRNPQVIPDLDLTTFRRIISTFKFINTGGLQELSEDILIKGWYWGSADQKLIGTPDNWIYQEAGRSSCWHNPEVNCN